MITRDKILQEMKDCGLTVIGYAEKHKMDIQDVWDVINGK